MTRWRLSRNTEPCICPDRPIALTAAAAVAALLLLPGRALPPGVEPPIERQASLPTVETMSGQRVAVLRITSYNVCYTKLLR